MNEARGFTRREMLVMVAGLGGITLAGSTFAQDVKRMFTPPLTVGPFYPQIKPLDQDADLTIINGNKSPAEGKIIHIAGRVTNIKGEAVINAKIEIWQADSHGRYSHKSDPNKAPLDINFQGYCVLNTDNEGRYRFKTIMPAAYPGLIAGMRTPHIHFDVLGKHDRVTTQMFFPDEPLNKTDRIYQDMRGESAQAAVTAKLRPPTKDMLTGEQLFEWDVVMLTG